MRFFAVALFFCGATASSAQPPVVPHKMGFAGIPLTLSDGVRQEIQLDVNMLTKHVRYFNMHVERARAYFPIIEKIFEEEGVPVDFKFLALQESALVADAVSVSDAVGFWQFKDFTAMEMGLRVDKEIDERMNLISSTRGAARYLKQNNYYFNNWLLALQSYQMGAGGVQRAMGDSLNGAKNMEITTGTYWYVKRFLAYKAAFENAVSGDAQVKLISYEPKTKMTLKEIAKEVSVGEEELKEYNKWLKTSSIPTDKLYTVLIPVGNVDQNFTKLVLASKSSREVPEVREKGKPDAHLAINSIPVVVAKAGENAALLAQRGGVSISSFLKNNDIPIDHAVRAGDLYFLSRKKTTAQQDTYKVRAGDGLWSISQQFGIKIKSIKKYNRMSGDPVLVPGSVVWLKASKPKDDLVSSSPGEAVTLEDDSFDWYIKPPVEMSTITGPARPAEALVYTKPLIETAPIVRSIIKKEEESGPLPKANEHRVSPGESLYSIARQYNIQVTELLTWNNLTIQNGLKPGQILKVVENEDRAEVKTPQPLMITHEVKASDTLYSVARQYGVTIKDIMDWNHKKDFSLSQGEKLEIRQSNR
ncbi:MAG TPA: LysM peptidoglycan-binding domain-containing protein [Cyclobacteriaceae bacterium]|nr:LysM peptidoglycan-binding domain-containing protein [Cyclobacteriaceae bacterium]